MAQSENKFRTNVNVFEEFMVHFSNGWIERVSEKAFETAANTKMVKGNAGVVIADDITVRELNGKYRGINENTDVLAFSNLRQGHYYGENTPDAGTDPFITPPRDSVDCGEVIISYPQALLQASKEGHDVKKELIILLAHGLLHLLGYDHELPDEEVQMKAIQDIVVTEALKVE